MDEYQKVIKQFITEKIGPNTQCIFKLDPNWSSQNSDFRKKIRTDLINELKTNFNLIEFENLEDTNQIPKLKSWSISISHSKSFGAYIAIQIDEHKCSIGIDFEDVNRIKMDILERVSNTEEIELYKNQKELWPAKEAAFKALAKQHSNLRLLSDLKVVFNDLESDQVSFKVQTLNDSKRDIQIGLNSEGLILKSPLQASHFGAIFLAFS